MTGIPSSLGNAWAHRLMVLALAAVIALALFTIGVMEYPFSGGVRIPTEAFELILERFETSRLSDLSWTPTGDALSFREDLLAAPP